MCFDQPSSATFAAVGALVAMIANRKLKSMGGGAARGANRFSIGVAYFVLMEALQAVQYSYIDQCESSTNQLLTILGFAHICGQPYFTHVMCGAFYHPKSTRGIQNAFTLSMCVVAGLAFFMRYIFAVVYPLSDYIPLDGKACPNTEWIRASSLTPGGENASCTFNGNYHLAWSVPMYQPTYLTPGPFIHCFVMFVPFLLTPGFLAKGFGIFLFLTGPYMASVVTPNLNEQASVWCFFSIAQITLMFCGVLLTQGPAKEEAPSGGRRRSSRGKKSE